MCATGGGEVVYMENRAAEKWLRSSSAAASMPARVAFAFRPPASAPGATQPPAAAQTTRSFLRQRARAFDALFPPAAASGGQGASIMGTMVSRVQVELSDVAALRTRVQQQKVFRSINPSLEPTAAGGGGGAGSGNKAGRAAAKGAAAAEGGASGWYREQERVAGSSSSSSKDAAFQAQLARFT